VKKSERDREEAMGGGGGGGPPQLLRYDRAMRRKQRPGVCESVCVCARARDHFDHLHCI
jgi:hypothetical protein